MKDNQEINNLENAAVEETSASMPEFDEQLFNPEEKTEEAPVEEATIEAEAPAADEKPAKREKKPINKKLLAIILGSVGGVLLIAAIVLACVFLIKSDSDKMLEATNAMLQSNAPTKVVVNTTRDFGGEIELHDVMTLITGRYDGKRATVFTHTKESFSTIEDGSTEIETPFIKSETTKKEFLEDKGVRVNGGKWDDEEYDFAPAAGDISLNLFNSNPFTKDNLTNVFVNEGTIYATIPAAKASAVLGEEFAVEYDMELEIGTYDGFVTYIIITYVIPETKDYPEITVTIEAEYSYGIQSVTID